MTVNKEEILKEAPPKPILIEDLGMMFATEKSKQKSRYGIYECGFCGTRFKANTYDIKSKKTKSCGCYNKKRTKERNTKHGLKGIRLYTIWRNMKKRTTNINDEAYPNYGGRGITICDDWKNDFMSFYNWAMSNGYSEELSIDRIDNDGKYEPSNCRWTTRTIQSRNQRMPKNNTSGYKGVSFSKNSNLYRVRIDVNKKNIHLGLYLNVVEGAIAYNNYIIENNLEGFILNEIPEEYLNQYIKEEN